MNRRKKQVSRLAHEFSQAAAANDTQPHQEAADCHNRVPGMSQYGEADVEVEVGKDVLQKLPQEADTESAASESEESNFP